MEAEVSPLPRELTTPPVTKMCFVIARQSLRGRVFQPHYIARRATNNQRSRSGRVKMSSSGPARPASPAVAVPLNERGIIGRRVHAAVRFAHDPDVDRAPRPED